MNVLTAVLMSTLLATACARSAVQPDVPRPEGDASESRTLQPLFERVASDPRDPTLRIQLGKALLNEGYVRRALDEFQTAISLSPTDPSPYLLVATAAKQIGGSRDPRILPALQSATMVAPQDAICHLSLAHAYAELPDTDRALAEFDLALRMSQDPRVELSAHLGRLAIYQARADARQSEAELSAARGIEPRIDSILIEEDIRRATPAPQADGVNLEAGDGVHPPINERIRRTQQEAARMEGSRP